VIGPDNTQHSQEANIHAPHGIRTHNSRNERPQTHALGLIFHERHCRSLLPFPTIASVSTQQRGTIPPLPAAGKRWDQLFPAAGSVKSSMTLTAVLRK